MFDFAFLSPAFLENLIQVYGLWVLFAIVFFESMGVPLPGETALISAALFAGSTGRLGIAAIIGTAMLAAMLGDNMGYLIGRTLGSRLLIRYGPRFGIKLTTIKVGQYLFMIHGRKIVFFGRFVAFLRTFAALLAGVNRMDWRSFIVMNGLGAALWATVFGLGAYLLGERIHRVAGPAGILILVTAAGLLVLGAHYVRRHGKDLERRAFEALGRAEPNEP